MALTRLDQLLSRCGYCSRREARVWVKAGRIAVNGAPARSPDQKVDAATVTVDAEPIEGPEGLLVILHKPAGYVCSHALDEGATVHELLPARWRERNPMVTTVGRLDKDTTGVLLLTDLGPLVQRWTSPRHHVDKVYRVEVEGEITAEHTAVFASGTLMLTGEDSPCEPASLEIVSPSEALLTLQEGRYHQVKRMFASQGLVVTRLHRERFGDYTNEGLAPGEWRMLPLPAS